jgi:hypothetical protein
MHINVIIFFLMNYHVWINMHINVPIFVSYMNCNVWINMHINVLFLKYEYVMCASIHINVTKKIHVTFNMNYHI